MNATGILALWTCDVCTKDDSIGKDNENRSDDSSSRNGDEL